MTNSSFLLLLVVKQLMRFEDKLGPETTVKTTFIGFHGYFFSLLRQGKHLILANQAPSGMSFDWCMGVWL